MRIAILADFPAHVIPGFGLPPPAGHYATWLPQLSAAWADRKAFEIHWLFIVRRPGVPARLEWNGQTFHAIHVPGRLRALRGYRQDCALIHKKLAEISPDLVHAWGTEDCYGLAAARSGRPFLLSMQGILSHYVLRNRMHPLVYLQAAYELWTLAQTKEITVESTWGAELVQRRAPRARVQIVEYGVQFPFFDVKWNPEPSQPAALFVGSIHPRKGIQDAVRAFSDGRLRNAELWVVGGQSGKFAAELQRNSGANVRWLGRQTPEQTAQFLSRAWCLVLPTRADTSPNVVKEARVVGLPVVTTPDGGQRDYIQNGANGFLVRPDDINGLADALSALLGDLDLARRMGAERHAEQRAYFRPENTADRLEAIYRELAPATGGA